MTKITPTCVMAAALAMAFAAPASAQQPSGQQGQNPQQMDRQSQAGQQGQMRRQQTRIPDQFRQERGRVVEVRPVRVRNVGTPNYLLVIETQPDRRVVADIGQQKNNNLRVGTPVTVRGEIVRIGDRGALLLADAVRIGDRVYDVSRPAFRRSASAAGNTPSAAAGSGSGTASATSASGSQK